MNIFYIDKDPQVCAQQHNDRHVVRMCYEYAEMLSYAFQVKGIDYGYRIRLNMAKHKSSRWTRENIENWRWLYKLCMALGEEYKYRFDHTEDHRSISIAKSLPEPTPDIVPDGEFYDPPLAMGYAYTFAENRRDCYRLFYRIGKAYFNEWKRREVPPWINTILDEVPYSDWLKWFEKKLNDLWVLSEGLNIEKKKRRLFYMLKGPVKKLPEEHPKKKPLLELIQEIENNYPVNPGPLWTP